MTFPPILTPAAPQIAELCDELSRLSVVDTAIAWPSDALRLCGDAGVYRWFLPQSVGGYGWTDADQTQAYLKLAAADLTTTFIITQRMGACRRIASSENSSVARRWMPRLLGGDAFATVAISHLTTSRQHLKNPALSATPCEVTHAPAASHAPDAAHTPDTTHIPDAAPSFILNGFSPWVTGGAYADVLVVGATLPGGRQLLAAVDGTQQGILPSPGTALVALSSSCTDRVDFQNTVVRHDQILSGPSKDVMGRGGGNTGGLQTSTLAIGLATAAARFLQLEASKRQDLQPVATRLADEVSAAQQELLAAAAGQGKCDVGEIRGQANRLVLRATQAALTAAKGAGFVEGHPVGRWCREALFFLVWSCPQPVANAYLCELAGLE